MSPEAFLTMVIILVRPFFTSRYTGMKPPLPVLATWTKRAASGAGGGSDQGECPRTHRTIGFGGGEQHVKRQLGAEKSKEAKRTRAMTSMLRLRIAVVVTHSNSKLA